MERERGSSNNKNGREVLYHSVLLVRTDRQELRGRKRRRRIRDRRAVDGLGGRLERRTDWLRRKDIKEGMEMVVKR